jgi:hypothetical protein
MCSAADRGARLTLVTEPVRIVAVELRGSQGREFWRVKTSDGNAYATTNPVIAGEVSRAHEAQQPVRIHHYGGWYYRDITGLEIAS